LIEISLMGTIQAQGCCRKKRASNRVIRGGSWNNNARNCRSANRNNNNPSNRNNNNGFRLALSPARQVTADAGLPTKSNIPPLQFEGQKEAPMPILVTGSDDRREGFGMGFSP
jgi:hypothetical protein